MGHVGQGLQEQVHRLSKPREAAHGRHCSTVLGTPAKRYFLKLFLAQKQNFKVGNYVM